MARKVKTKKKSKRLFLMGSICIIICIFTLTTILSSVKQIIEKYSEAKELETTLADLEEKESELNNEITKLEDPDYLARYAREHYFYSKKDEYIIRIPEEDE